MAVTTAVVPLPPVSLFPRGASGGHGLVPELPCRRVAAQKRR